MHATVCSVGKQGWWEKLTSVFCCLFFLANAAQAACTNTYPRETVSLYTRWVRQEFYSGVYLSITLSCVFFVRPSLHRCHSSGSSYTLTWPPVVWLAQHWWRTVVSSINWAQSVAMIKITLRHLSMWANFCRGLLFFCLFVFFGAQFNCRLNKQNVFLVITPCAL